jgi:hypothetical protein
MHLNAERKLLAGGLGCVLVWAQWRARFVNEAKACSVATTVSRVVQAPMSSTCRRRSHSRACSRASSIVSRVFFRPLPASPPVIKRSPPLAIATKAADNPSLRLRFHDTMPRRLPTIYAMMSRTGDDDQAPPPPPPPPPSHSPPMFEFDYAMTSLRRTRRSRR